MTAYGWNRETQTLDTRRVWPDCDLCGRSEGARIVIIEHHPEIGAPSGTRACIPCKQQVDTALPKRFGTLLTMPCPSWHWPEPCDLSDDDRREYRAMIDEKRPRRPRKLTTPRFESLPAWALTDTQRRWDEQHWDDHLDDLEFDRMATE